MNGLCSFSVASVEQWVAEDETIPCSHAFVLLARDSGLCIQVSEVGRCVDLHTLSGAGSGMSKIRSSSSES